MSQPINTLPCSRCRDVIPETLLKDGLCNSCRVTLSNEKRREAEGARTFLAGRAADTPKPVKEATFDPSEQAKRELARRELARRRFLPFVQRFKPDYMPGWVHADICQRLERFVEQVKNQESPRLMIFMPPRHGKSELTSASFPAWVLGHYPNWEFMLCSYSSALAMKFSRQVRAKLRDPSYHSLFDTRLDPESQSAEEWATTAGGALVASGVGGAITGKGAHIMLIDDPVKNREDAESETVRAATFDWYTSTAYTRLAPGGGVLIIQTRWHDDDLSGRLVAAQSEGGDSWEIVQYPAIAEHDEEFRTKGEALHPARYPQEALTRIRKAIGERDWWALYQQQPVSDEGSYFTRDMISYYQQHTLPDHSELVFYTAWDLAIGQKEHNDYTVGITVAIDRDENLWVVDRCRGKWDSLQICDEMIETWFKWESEITGIEHGQINMAIGPFLEKRKDELKAWGLYVEPLKTGRRDKPARARPIQGMLRAGKVKFPHPEDCPWVLELVNELLRFPAGVHDDQVDALAWIGQMIVEMAPSVAKREPKKKSWKDKLEKYITSGDDRKRWQAA